MLSSLCKPLPYPDFDEVFKSALMEEDFGRKTSTSGGLSRSLKIRRTLWKLLLINIMGIVISEPTFEKLAVFMLVTNVVYALNGELLRYMEKNMFLQERPDRVVFFEQLHEPLSPPAAYDRLGKQHGMEKLSKEYIDN